MKLSRPARLSVALATVALATAGLASCSTSSTPSTGSTSGAGASSGTAASAAATPTPTADAVTYTADDLTGILTAAEAKLGVSGKILDDAAVKKAQGSLGSGGLGAIFDQPGLTISPAACKAKIKSGLTTTPPAGTVSADLVYGSSTVGLATVSGQALPATSKDGGARLDALLAQCSDMTLTVQGQSVGLKIAKSTATTSADQTTAIDETLSIPSAGGAAAGTVTLTLISAVKGNLIIIGSGVTKSTVSALPAPAAGTPTPAQAVDAAIVAAAQRK